MRVILLRQCKQNLAHNAKEKKTHWLLVSMHAVMQKGLAKSFVCQLFNDSLLKKKLFNDFANVLTTFALRFTKISRKGAPEYFWIL
jgi:hypothetical protein